ncbi:MAG: class I SAM-dependent methyltransferase [Pseudomonadota bacterium]
MTPEQIQKNLRSTITTARIEPTPLPLVPEIVLYLISADYPRGRLDNDEMLRVMNAPAYWAFCWASGQVLARYLLDNPGLVAGKSVLDLGCGSGVVGIAASLAGAERVIACDNDPFALAATLANAQLAGVTLDLLANLDELDQRVDLAIAADVLYDRDNMPLLAKLPGLAETVLVADSRIRHLGVDGYEIVQRNTATTVPDLDEMAEFNDVRVYRSTGVRLPTP